jgi:hypothetical protein
MYVLMFASALFVGRLNIVVMIYLTTAILAASISRGIIGTYAESVVLFLRPCRTNRRHEHIANRVRIY